MITAVVFDFDGVLANSEPLHLMASRKVFASLGVEVTRDDYFAHYLGYDDREMFRRFAEREHLALDAKKLQALIVEKARIFDKMLDDTDVLYPEAAECVRRLAARFPLAIASGALRHEIEMVLARARLDSYFRFIIAAGDTVNGKPSPDPYVLAAERHGMPARACVAIEDSKHGIAAAKAAGMKSVGITTSYSAQELRAADLVVASLAECTADLILAL
jgi:HAD superfamily hydrolase (TIGR01509 family)